MNYKLLVAMKFLTLSILAFNCGSDTTQPKQTSDTVTKHLDTLPKVEQVASKKDSLGNMFYNKQPFEIISLKKGVTLQYTGPDDTSACNKWAISKKELYSIIRNSSPITGTTWDLAFAFSTCIIEGQIRQQEQLFNYSLNAGSWFHIECRDTALLFGNYEKQDRKYFLDSAETH
jgi:hypothetical protein